MVGRTGGVCFRSKNDFASIAGVTGVEGPLLSTEEASLPVLFRKLRSIVEKSESLPEEIEPEDDPEMLLISGAVRACTLVVEINSVGKEMRLRSIVPGAYLTVVLRCIEGCCSTLRLTRLVKAREIDMFEGEPRAGMVYEKVQASGVLSGETSARSDRARADIGLCERVGSHVPFDSRIR